MKLANIVWFLPNRYVVDLGPLAATRIQQFRYNLIAGLKDSAMTDFPDELKALPKFWGAEDAKVYDITGVKAENGWQILFSNYDAGFALGEHTHETENLGVVLGTYLPSSC